MKNGCEDISMSEILHFLGVPEKYIDRKYNPVYSLINMNESWFQNANEILLRFQSDEKNSI